MEVARLDIEYDGLPEAFQVERRMISVRHFWPYIDVHRRLEDVRVVLIFFSCLMRRTIVISFEKDNQTAWRAQHIVHAALFCVFHREAGASGTGTKKKKKLKSILLFARSDRSQLKATLCASWVLLRFADYTPYSFGSCYVGALIYSLRRRITSRTSKNVPVSAEAFRAWSKKKKNG